MAKEDLKQQLFRQDTRLFAILDGASITELPKLLHRSNLPNFCLFPGDLAPNLSHAAPYLVYLPADDPFTETVIKEGSGKHWGIFAHSRHSLQEMRRHFRGLVTAHDERGQTLTFRFYDPRVIGKYLPTCTAQELGIFFGKVERFFAEAGEDGSMKTYSVESGKLKVKEL